MTAAKLRPNALLSLHRRNHVKKTPFTANQVYMGTAVLGQWGSFAEYGVKRAVVVLMVKLYIGAYKV
jgi:hypothetical protein